MATRRHIVLGTAAAAAGAVALRGALAGPSAPASARLEDAQSTEWGVEPPQAHGLDAVALEQLLSDAAAVRGMRSLLVARDGVLVGERYYDRTGANELQPIHSCTKSLCSLLVGQALERGTLPGLDATVGELLSQPGADQPSAAARASLRQLLTGRSAVAYDWSRQMRELEQASDPVRYALALPADAQGAGRWTYNDAAISLLSPILARVEGSDLADLARRDLFAPLGITHFGWRRDRADLPLAYGGVSLRPRDLLKLAWMTLDGGRWRGRQVVPAPWVAQSTASHGPAGWRVEPVTDIGYGYLWFTGRLHGEAVAWAWGHGAQYALMVPRLRLAVVTMASAPPASELMAHNNAVMALVARAVQLAAQGDR
ncbi:serine hydrolase domain-containing protein [Ideonella sp. BN130291]|uniref:serine hydrolase domain-containing protein n=1 Tax=Ideonella sp. BN130291 TaxID=3112940 RepID=UPI002E2704D5|nr:serine hydrolase domain-containing protein [Ideonella sp. BN130291]